jgi:hypothetical protein
LPNFRIDIYAWIPQPDVPNPIAGLPGGTARWGPGACGPRFGGDNFVVPPRSHAAWAGTYRAKQSFAFHAASFGMPPVIVFNTGVTPGLTTVLTAPRSAGGSICYSLTPTVTKSTAGVEWKASDRWYEVKLNGAAHDPVPASALTNLFHSPGAGAIGHALTPDLEWDLTIRFQLSSGLPMSTRARYAVSSGLSLDASGRTFPAPTNFGGSSNLVHGLITVRRFPSYVTYVTIGPSAGTGVTIPLYFADASGRNLAEIVVGQTDPIRQLTW